MAAPLALCKRTNSALPDSQKHIIVLAIASEPKSGLVG